MQSSDHSRLTTHDSRAPSAALYGLVLAGGASKRMGQDKAMLEYHGKSQLAWTFDLVSSMCERSFVSVRPDQRDDPARAAFPQIADLTPGIGPIAGISAALTTHSGAAWLVLACDLPFISEATLKHLIDRRDPNRIATAYRSAHDGLPEPLCAIWEPRSLPLVQKWIASGKECPRKLLINSEPLLLEQLDVRSLDNINTPQERAEASATLS